MKKACFALILAAGLLVAGPAAAGPIPINFGNDIVTLTGAAFAFPGGEIEHVQPGAGETATVGPTGVDGYAMDPNGDPIPVVGGLTLRFSAPAIGLWFDFFNVLSGPLDPEDVGVIALFHEVGEESQPDPDPLTPGTAYEQDPNYWVEGSLAYHGTPFTSVDIYFAQNTTNFSLFNMEYEPAPTEPVPEPASLMLLGTGMVGLARLARRRR